MTVVSLVILIVAIIAVGLCVIWYVGGTESQQDIMADVRAAMLLREADMAQVEHAPYFQLEAILTCQNCGRQERLPQPQPYVQLGSYPGSLRFDAVTPQGWYDRLCKSCSAARREAEYSAELAKRQMIREAMERAAGKRD